MSLFISGATPPSTPTPPNTPNITTVATSTTSTVVLAANAARRKFSLVNSSGTLFVALGGTASDTAYTFKLGAGDYYEGNLDDYTGVVSAIRQSGTGSVIVTEIT